jgi:cell division septum initiation protein DivIVA
VALDRQSIEKRDFPVGSSGYDPDAVDAHLAALADEVAELKRTARHRSDTLASSASEHVRAIVEAAETSARDIQREAESIANEIRDEANNEAQGTRDQAADQAREYVGRVSEATTTALQRLGEMEGELKALIESLRNGASRLDADIHRLEDDIAEVGHVVTPAVRPQFEPDPVSEAADAVPSPGDPGAQDDPGWGTPAASAEASAVEEDLGWGTPSAPEEAPAVQEDSAWGAPAAPEETPAVQEDSGWGTPAEPEQVPTAHEDSGWGTPATPEEPAAEGAAPAGLGPSFEPYGEPASPAENGAAAGEPVSPGESQDGHEGGSAESFAPTGQAQAPDDAEGARLIALNMALNGTPRDETSKYLSENFRLSDRDGLLDEVYASVEG